jgi:hypothetical protein
MAGTVRGFGNAGGIVGQNQVNTYIRRCYSTAAISTTGTNGTGTGGIAGMNASQETGSISGCLALNPSITATGANSTATPALSAEDAAKVHRVTGANATEGNGGYLRDNYAYSDMTIRIAGNTWTEDKGTNAKDGADCDTKPAQSVYTGLGWDFVQVWKMGGDSYPHLKWEQERDPSTSSGPGMGGVIEAFEGALTPELEE